MIDSTHLQTYLFRSTKVKLLIGTLYQKPETTLLIGVFRNLNNMKKEILIECLSLLPGGEGKIILDVKDIKPIETMEGTWEFTVISKRHESDMSEISFHNIIKERTYKMVEKWIGFVKQAGIPKELHMDACVLATNIIETQTKIDVARLINTTVDYDTSLLVANFRVLSRIKDLNNFCSCWWATLVLLYHL